MKTSNGAPSASMGVLARVNQSLSNDPRIKQKEFKKFKASQQGKDLVTWIKEQYTKTKQARSREVQQWNLNLAMYFGNQNVLVQATGPEAGKLFVPPKQRNVERLVINRVRPLIRTELARMLSQKPAASVVPASSEDEDLMAAMAGEQVWESIYTRRQFHRTFAKSAFWTATTGTGFLKTYWDDNKQDPDAPEPGDVVFSNIQPYNIFVPDLLEQEIEDQPFVLEVQVRPVEWLNYIFSNQLEHPVRPTARSAMSVLEDAYVFRRLDNTAQPDSAMVYELWIKPGGYKGMPNGGYAMVVGEELVEASLEGLPYQHQEYPYTKFEHIPTAKFYAASVIEDVIVLNKEYNKIRSQIADNRRKVGNIQFNAYKGSILPERVTNEVGLFNIIRPGMQMPTQVQPANLPSYISENMDRVLSDIEDVSGQHQVSKGNVPPGVTAATAISYLQERDDSLLTHTYQSIEQGVEKVARQTLNLSVQYWEQPRLVRVVGADGSFDAELLDSAKLVNGTDVRIEAGSALPQSKAAKQALITDFMKFGWIQPDDGLKMMEIGGAQKIFEQIRTDERQAQRENVRLKSLTPEIIAQHKIAWQEQVQKASQSVADAETGEILDAPPVISVNSYDNHAVHIEVHNRYRRGQAFELLSPEVKEEFESHVQQHKYMLMQEQTMGMAPGMLPGESSELEPPPEEISPPGESGGLTDMMREEGGQGGP